MHCNGLLLCSIPILLRWHNANKTLYSLSLSFIPFGVVAVKKKKKKKSFTFYVGILKSWRYPKFKGKIEMGSCASVHKSSQESAMKVGLSLGSKTDNIIIPPSTVKEKSDAFNGDFTHNSHSFSTFKDLGNWVFLFWFLFQTIFEVSFLGYDAKGTFLVFFCPFN